MCEEGKGDYLARIDEPQTCSYIVVVHTMRICHHPYLKPPQKAKTRPIVCNPVLPQEQYELYLHLEGSKYLHGKKIKNSITDILMKETVHAYCTCMLYFGKSKFCCNIYNLEFICCCIILRLKPIQFIDHSYKIDALETY